MVLPPLTRQLPHTGGDAVHDMKRHGPTTQDNQGEPNVSFSVHNTRGIRLSNTH